MATLEEKKYSFVPRNNHLEFIRDKSQFLCLVGAAGTGKSRTALEKLHLLAEKYAGCNLLIARKIRSSLNDTALVTFEDKVLLPDHPANTKVTKKFRYQYSYPNGSVINVAGLDDTQKVMSSEYDIIYIQEMKEATEDDIQDLKTRLRNGVIPYQQIIGDTNPDGQHHWLYQSHLQKRVKFFPTTHFDNPVYFQLLEDLPKIDQIREAQYITERMFDTYNETDEMLHFYGEYEDGSLSSFLVKQDSLKYWCCKDMYGRIGRWTRQGIAYVATLSDLVGVKRLRLFLGIWASSEGVIYSMYDDAHHCIRTPIIKNVPILIPPKENVDGTITEGEIIFKDKFVIQQSDRVICALDFGFNHPFVFLLAVVRDKVIYIVKQIYMSERTVETHCQDILNILGYKYENRHLTKIRDDAFPIPEAFICDHDAEGRATFEQHTGFKTTSAFKKVKDGIDAVAVYLQKKKLFIDVNSLYEVDRRLQERYHPTCLQEEMPAYSWRRKSQTGSQTEYDEPKKEYDHACDGLRYLVAYIENLREKIKADDVVMLTGTQNFEKTYVRMPKRNNKRDDNARKSSQYRHRR